MKVESPIISDGLDAYFCLMDQAPVVGDSIFKNSQAKERHESVLMYAFRKYQAANYHFDRVIQLSEEESSNIATTNSLDTRISQLAESSIRVSVRKSADKFIYELSAFLQAVKSSLDFLTTALAVYIKGVQADSIKTFISLVENSREGPIFRIVKPNLPWLSQLRDYRHHLVHRMVITSETVHGISTFGDKICQFKYPIVIPIATPCYFPDTRISRMMNDEVNGLDFASVNGWITYPDGTQEVLEFSEEYSPAKGYVEITEFMTSNLLNLENFFCDILEDAKTLNFRMF